MNNNRINPLYTGEEFKILYENEDIIAFDKPVNTHSVCQKYTDTNTLHNFMQTTCFELLEVNQGSYNRGLINRLDFETSGILIYAKNTRSYNELRSNFNTVFKQKKYQAVVSGEITQLGEIIDELDLGGTKVKVSKGGVVANLVIEKSTYNPDNNSSLLEISLVTGHRHQIRVQLANMGNPILGDSLYGTQEIDRLMLHAFEYEFELNNEFVKILSKKRFT